VQEDLKDNPFLSMIDEEMAAFDPIAAEVLRSGLKKPEDLVMIGHELSHAKLDRRQRTIVNAHYKTLERIVSDKSLAEERLESGDRLSEEERLEFIAAKNYQVTEEDMLHITGAIEEELRADITFLQWLETVKSVIFPNDPDLLSVRDFLSRAIKTYLDTAKVIGAEKFIGSQQEEDILNLKYPTWQA
jgi:hypothetical protein